MSSAEGPRNRKERIFTIPNLLGFARLFATPFLLILAARDQRIEFLLLILAFFLTDWLDGRLARWLGQETDLGARLDSLSDVVLYTVLCLGVGKMERAWCTEHVWWFAAVASSYLLNVVVSLARFGRVPSYHTRAAKMGWGLVGIAAVTLLMRWSDVPSFVAMTFVTLANLEMVVMSLVLPEARVDVTGLPEAFRIREAARREDVGGASDGTEENPDGEGLR